MAENNKFPVGSFALLAILAFLWFSPPFLEGTVTTAEAISHQVLRMTMAQVPDTAIKQNAYAHHLSDTFVLGVIHQEMQRHLALILHPETKPWGTRVPCGTGSIISIHRHHCLPI